MRRALDLWPLVLGLLTLVGGLDPTKPPDDNATNFMTHVTPEGTQSTWDGDIPAINQGLIPEESPESSFLVEGDIIKRPFQLFSAASFKWPKKDGIVKIPYLFSSKYDQPSREVILEAFADFEHFTCVRFVPRTNQKDFVSIIPMSGCFSSVGHSGGMQVASLAPFCLQKGKGIVLHELMHVLGFWHEHSRADRDRYIHISWKEIRPGFEINFIKSQNSNMLVPYDYTSVMHYGRYAFSKNGNTTILPLAGPNIPIGQRWNLSASDIVRINRLYECSQTVKDPGLHRENNGSHRKLGVVELIDQKEKKLRPTETPTKALPSLQAVSQSGKGDKVSPSWPNSAPSEHPWGKEMANTTWPTWSTSASSPGAAQIPEIVSPSEAVPSETTKNRPPSLYITERTLLVSEPSTSAPLLTLLSRGTTASFPEPWSLPETHSSMLAVGQRGGLPGSPLPGREGWSEGTAPLLSGKASFSGLQSPSPDWRAGPKSAMASIRTSHPSPGSSPGPHRCQLCRQEETATAPTAGGGGLESEGRGFFWRLLRALTMASASRNLPALQGARAQGLGAGDQLFSTDLRGDTPLPEPPGVVLPAHGTHNPQNTEEPTQTLMEGKKRDFREGEKLKRIAFGEATDVPNGPARQKLSLSAGQGSTWPRWGPRHETWLSSEKDVLEQPRRDSSSGDQVGAHLSQVMSLPSSHNLSWTPSMALSPREEIPVLERGNRDFMVPGAGLGNPVIPRLGVASSSTREEFGSGPSTLFPVKKAPTISQEGELHSLQIQASQSEVGLPNTLPAADSQTPSSTPVAPALSLKPLTNKILAQTESPVLAAFTQTSHLSHLMENVMRNRFIFPVSPRTPPYLGMETPDEVFQRSGGAHSEVRTTTVDGKEERQIGSLFTVGSAFPEGEVASPAVSVNSILSLEDSGNQKPHPSGRIIQGSLGGIEKNQILSSAPLRRCPPGGIQLFLGGSMIPLLPMEPERMPRGYKSKETLKFLPLRVGRKVASFPFWISNSSSVTLGHSMPLPQSLEHPQSQTFLFAEIKPEMLRPERTVEPKLAGPRIVLLKSPSGLLSLVPLWECWDPSGVKELAYFSEPEALEKEYSPASGESSSSATEAMVLPLQTLKTQIPFLNRSQEKKGRHQLGITPIPLTQTKVKMVYLVRDKVIQILGTEHGTSEEQGGRDPKFPPFRVSFEALPLRNPSLGSDAFQRRALPALGTQTSNWAGRTLPPLASLAVGPEPWLQEGGTAWTRPLPGEPMVNEGRLEFQDHSKLLSLTGPGMEPQVTDIPFAREVHNEKAREEGKTPSPSPSRPGRGNKPSMDYFNPREPPSVNLFDHKAWMAQQGVQSRPTDDEHIIQILPYGSLPSVRRETVSESFTTFRTDREAEELRNVVGKTKSLVESSTVHSERAKSSSSQLHLVNLSSPLDRPMKSTKTKSKVHGSQGRKGGLASFSSVGITFPLDKTSYFSITIPPSLSPSTSPSLSPSTSPSLSPSTSLSLSPSTSPSLSPFTSHSFSSPLPQNLAVTKLSTVASVIRKATTLRTYQQSPPLQNSGFWQGPHKANIGNPASRTPQTCDQAEQGGGCAQSPEHAASGDSSGNINSQGPRLGSLPHLRWLEPVSFVRLGAQRQSSELGATSGHSWLCLDGDCWEVMLQSLESSQDLETTGVKSLWAKSPRPKPLHMEGAGTGPLREVQMLQEGHGSLQPTPHIEPVHPDWSAQSLSSGPHSVGNLSLRPALSGSRTQPWFFDWFCDFETDLCGWQQNGTGAVWVLTRDQNSYPWRSSYPMESSCTFPGGSHLSLKSQTSPQMIPKAVLISPILHGARWVRFWYGPLQPAMGTISVYVYSRAQFGWHLIWSSMGHRSLSWSWVEMKLWTSRKIQVMVEGVQGPEDGAHVSIDNLSVSSHQWQKGETKLPCHSFKEALNKT